MLAASCKMNAELDWLVDRYEWYGYAKAVSKDMQQTEQSFDELSPLSACRSQSKREFRAGVKRTVRRMMVGTCMT